MGRAVASFVASSLVAVVVFAIVAFFVFQDRGTNEAIRAAREVGAIAGRGIVEPNLGAGVLAGRPEALARLDRVVQERLLSDRIVRVKIWSRDGRILYSDEPRLIGQRYRLGIEELAALDAGAVEAELSDLSKPENRYERGQGKLLEVYLPVRGPGGTPLLFELYQRFSAISASGRRIWLSFAPALFGALILLWLVQVPLAWSMANRLRQSQRGREALLTKALDASDAERLRIAGDLHDGVVQDLAGISYSLAAAAETAPPAAGREFVTTLREGAAGTRDSMRRLRSLLVEIHPSNLHASGLESALSDLLTPLRRLGIETTLEVDDEGLGDETESLIFRAAREAVRNVHDHAGARRVAVRVERLGGRVRLTVEDDGRGFEREERERRRAEGHVGLSLLEELVERNGGALHVSSRPQSGTTFTIEVPA